MNNALTHVRQTIRKFRDREKAHRAAGQDQLADQCALYVQEWRDRETKILSKGM